MPQDESVCLKVYQINYPEFPFGETQCRIMLYGRDGKTISSQDVFLKNDGKNAGEENFEIIWTEGEAVVVIRAEEQEDEVCSFRYQ